MDSFFVEKFDNDKYQIALVDKTRIFSADNPGLLATVYECSNESPSIDDNTQIFYALIRSINGMNIFSDLTNKNRSCKLNTWSIKYKDNNILTVEQINYQERIELYSKHHDITPDNTEDIFLSSLIDFSKRQNNWKTGILQRCIDNLVKSDYRKNPKVYALIDVNYNKIMRFKHETECENLLQLTDGNIIHNMRKITSILGIKNTRDTKIFNKISHKIKTYLDYFKNKIPKLKEYNSDKSLLSELFFLWCGSKIIDVDDGYQLKLNEDITECLTYMQPLLKQPKYLEILEKPM